MSHLLQVGLLQFSLFAQAKHGLTEGIHSALYRVFHIVDLTLDLEDAHLLIRFPLGHCYGMFDLFLKCHDNCLH